MSPATGVPALELQDLRVTYRSRGRDRTVIDGLSLTVARGESYGLVGESGCGKSTAALAVMRALGRGGAIASGRVLVDGVDVGALDAAALREFRARTASMVFQDPIAALNPTLDVGTQLDEVFALRGADRAAARRASLDALDRVRIADPRAVVDRYPHQLSGGMAQRVVIAAALATEPVLLLLDEPTTGLDATVEAEVLELVSDLQSELGTSVVLISHNLAVVAATCSRVGVLYSGRMAEEGRVADVFSAPRHPYTVGLLRCLPGAGTHKSTTRLATIPGVLPQLGDRPDACAFADRCSLAEDVCRTEAPALLDLGSRLAACHFTDRVPSLTAASLDRDEPFPASDRSGAPLLGATAVRKTFFQGRRPMRALREVDLAIWPGETLGLVGESGSGKTTLARILLGLLPPDKGAELTLRGEPLATDVDARPAQAVSDVQIVFQNPAGALNPRHTVARILGRAVRRLRGLRGEARRDRVTDLMDAVRLRPEQLTARPAQLSGGMKQRVAIARAFAGDPALVVCDEPTSALDVSVQAAILNLLSDLQERDRVSYLLISHDLGVVRYLSDRIAVLYLGEVLEVGPVEEVFAGPRSPYTTVLLDAVPTMGGPRPRPPAAAPATAAATTAATTAGATATAATATTATAAGATAGATLSDGCPFAPRCPHTLPDVCASRPPPEVTAGPDHVIRCHLPLDELRAASGLPGSPTEAGHDRAGRAHDR